MSRGGGCGPARGVATCCGALAVCARAAACLLRMTEGGVCRGVAGLGEGSGGRRASMGACGAAAVSPSGSSTCVLCLGMKRHPPLAGSASMPGATTSAWRRFICLRIMSGTISSTVSDEYSSGIDLLSCSHMLGLCLACSADVAVDDSRSAAWARLPLHLPISLVSGTGSPPALDTHTRSCLGLWPVSSMATSLGSAHGDSCASDLIESYAR